MSSAVAIPLIVLGACGLIALIPIIWGGPEPLVDEWIAKYNQRRNKNEQS